MNKLTIEHLAPYLPYGLQIHWNTSKRTSIVRMQPSNISDVEIYTTNFKPILRPLSDLTKEIEHNGETLIVMHRILESYCFDVSKMTNEEVRQYSESMIEVDMAYQTGVILFTYHFDVFGLIERGLAININDV